MYLVFWASLKISQLTKVTKNSLYQATISVLFEDFFNTSSKNVKNSLFLEKSKEIQFQANFVFTDSNCDFKSTSFIFDTKDKSFTLNNRFLSTNHQPIDAFASAFHQAISSSWVNFGFSAVEKLNHKSIFHCQARFQFSKILFELDFTENCHLKSFGISAETFISALESNFHSVNHSNFEIYSSIFLA